MVDKYLNKKSLQSFQSLTACDMISRNLDDEWEIDKLQGKGVQILRSRCESTTNNDYHTNEDIGSLIWTHLLIHNKGA